jgi:hypothetical protein
MTPCAKSRLEPSGYFGEFLRSAQKRWIVRIGEESARASEWATILDALDTIHLLGAT